MASMSAFTINHGAGTKASKLYFLSIFDKVNINAVVIEAKTICLLTRFRTSMHPIDEVELLIDLLKITL